MPRHGKRSHVFAPKSKPKAKQSSAAKGKKEKSCSRTASMSTSDTSSSISQSVNEHEVSSATASITEDLRETSTVVKDITTVTDIASTAIESPSNVSEEIEYSEESEELSSRIPSTSNSDEPAIGEDEMKVSRYAKGGSDAWKPDEDNLAITIAGSTHVPIVIFCNNAGAGATDTATSSQSPEESTTKDATAPVDFCSSPTIDEESPANEPEDADDFPSQSTYKGARIMTPMESMGPSIMFNGLFGNKDTTLLGSVPPYRQNISPSTPAHHDQPEQVSAYQTRSHSSWFSNPANMTVRGVRYGTNRTVTELQRVVRTKTVSQLVKQPVVEVSGEVVDDKTQSTPVSDDTVPFNTAHKTEVVMSATPNIVERREHSESATRIRSPFSGKMAMSTVAVTDPLLDGITFQADNDNTSSRSDRERIAEVDPDFSDNEDGEDGGVRPSSSSTRIYVPLSGKMAPSTVVVTDPLLDGISFRDNKGTTPIWCQRDPIPEIDPDFSDDEDDYLRTSTTLNHIVALSTPIGVSAWVANLPIITKKASGVTIPSSLESYDDFAVRSSPDSSRPSVESIEFHKNNTFLGTTSMCDLLDHIHPDVDGKIPKEAVARSFVLCVASEHADRRSMSPNYDVPGVTFMSLKDAQHALKFETQCRAKLGRISLKEFLKKVNFDAEDMITEAPLFDAFRQAAIESKERIKADMGSPTARALRRNSVIARSKSGSSS